MKSATTVQIAYTQSKPFLKFVGGKRQLLPQLLPFLPRSFNRYYEPFVGGGALFFALRSAGYSNYAVLGDVNSRLVRTYRGVQSGVEKVIEGLKFMPYDKEEFQNARDMKPDEMKRDTDVAVWMIYLNKSCFNGLYRVNKAGQFNVPFGRYTNPTICDAEGLRSASEALQGVGLRVGDFEANIQGVAKGDVVYFDPPYVPVSTTSNFTGYSKEGFTFDDQKRLRDTAARLKKLGVTVILSNADVPAVRELYSKGFEIHAVTARRNINSKGGSRGSVGEVIVT